MCAEICGSNIKLDYGGLLKPGTQEPLSDGTRWDPIPSTAFFTWDDAVGVAQRGADVCIVLDLFSDGQTQQIV